MITKAAQVTIFVENQAEAKKYYTEIFGFVVRHELKFSPNWSYLTVAPNPDCETVLELIEATTSEEKHMMGKQAADQVFVMFLSDDIEKDFQDMKARGVQFASNEPQAVPGGRGVGFKDLYGNQFDIFQPDTVG